MSRILDGVSARFATPVSRPELESPLKTNSTASSPPPVPPLPPSAMSRKPVSKRSTSLDTKAHLMSPASDSSSPKTMDFAHTYKTPAAGNNGSSDVGGVLSGGGGLPVANGQSGNGFEPTSWSNGQLNSALTDLLGNHPVQNAGHTGLNPYGGRDPASSSSSVSFPHILQPQAAPFDFGGVAASNSYSWPDQVEVKPNVHFLSGLSSNSGLGGEANPTRSSGRSRSPDGEGGLVPTETDTVRYQGSATGMHHQALESSYTGSFWCVFEIFIPFRKPPTKRFVLYIGEVSQCTAQTTPILRAPMPYFRKVNSLPYMAHQSQHTPTYHQHIFNNTLQRFTCKMCIRFSPCSHALRLFHAATSLAAWFWHYAPIAHAYRRVWAPTTPMAQLLGLEMRHGLPLKCGMCSPFLSHTLS